MEIRDDRRRINIDPRAASKGGCASISPRQAHVITLNPRFGGMCDKCGVGDKRDKRDWIQNPKSKFKVIKETQLDNMAMANEIYCPRFGNGHCIKYNGVLS